MEISSFRIKTKSFGYDKMLSNKLKIARLNTQKNKKNSNNDKKSILLLKLYRLKNLFLQMGALII